MSVRISATDWTPDGLTPEESVAIAEAFHSEGADLIDVSAGQTTIRARPVYGRMFQTPFSDRIRNEGRLMTMAVGNIFEPDHVNSILAAGRADLCALARPHLIDPSWTLRAAALNTLFQSSFFLHFSGNRIEEMQTLRQRPTSWWDILT